MAGFLTSFSDTDVKFGNQLRDSDFSYWKICDEFFQNTSRNLIVHFPHGPMSRWVKQSGFSTPQTDMTA